MLLSLKVTRLKAKMVPGDRKRQMRTCVWQRSHYFTCCFFLSHLEVATTTFRARRKHPRQYSVSFGFSSFSLTEKCLHIGRTPAQVHCGCTQTHNPARSRDIWTFSFVCFCCYFACFYFNGCAAKSRLGDGLRERAKKVKHTDGRADHRKCCKRAINFALQAFMRRLGQFQRCGTILYQQRRSQIGFLQLYEVWIGLKKITVTLVEQVYRIFTSWMLHFPFTKRHLEHWSIPGDLMYSRLCPDHFAPSDLWTPSKPAFNDGKSTQCLFNLMADMKWGWVVKGTHSHVFQDHKFRSLTPPTSSKWPSPLAMSCPLKAQEKETSRTGSLATWHGNTMLSPTMISMSTGPWVILVGSTLKYPAHPFQRTSAALTFASLAVQPQLRCYKQLATDCTNPKLTIYG